MTAFNAVNDEKINQKDISVSVCNDPENAGR